MNDYSQFSAACASADNYRFTRRTAGARCAVSTGSARREIVRKRISKLAAREALGTATPSDIKKLERYQQLRRDSYQLEPEQRHQVASYDWTCRLMLKQMKALLRASQNIPVRQPDQKS